MINWQQERRTRQLLSKLDRTRVENVKRVAIPCDYHIFVGADRAAQRTLDALEARRTRAVERHVGGTFSELNAIGRGYEYLAADDLAPNVYSVVGSAL
jgi:hypothetical protein